MGLALIKLHTGTEILGDIIELDEEKIRVRDPLQVNYKFLSFQPMPAISVSRYMPFADEPVFDFAIGDIVHAVKPKPAVVEYYDYALKNYRDNIDTMIEKELLGASERPVSTTVAKEDFYKTLLERAENDDGILN